MTLKFCNNWKGNNNAFCNYYFIKNQEPEVDKSKKNKTSKSKFGHRNWATFLWSIWKYFYPLILSPVPPKFSSKEDIATCEQNKHINGKNTEHLKSKNRHNDRALKVSSTYRHRFAATSRSEYQVERFLSLLIKKTSKLLRPQKKIFCSEYVSQV